MAIGVRARLLFAVALTLAMQQVNQHFASGQERRYNLHKCQTRGMIAIVGKPDRSF